MARMRNMVTKLGSSKPVTWVKKHWIKIAVAIVVIYAIYWLFIEEDDMEHLTTADIAALKKAMDDAKADWDAAVKAEADIKNGTIPDPQCTSMSVTPSTTLGCPQYTGIKMGAYNLAKAAYDPYDPNKKSTKKSKKSSFGSKMNRFFSGIGKSFKRSTKKTKKSLNKVNKTFDSGSIEKGIGMKW